MCWLLLYPLMLGFSIGPAECQTPSIYDDVESTREGQEASLRPTVELNESKSPDKPNPRGFPGKSCANNSDTLELPASSEALLLGWVPTRLVPAIYGLVVVVGLPANGLALWVLATRVPRLPSTILLMNLAVADLLLALVLPPRLVYHLRGQRWPFGEAACRVATAALYGHMYGSVLLLAAVSLDRYLALVHPLRARAVRGQRLTTILCLVAWLSAATLVLPLTFHRQTFLLAGSDHMLCHDALPLAEQTSHWRPAFICLAVLGCFVPLLAMVLCYGATLRALAANGQRYSHAVRLTALVLFSAVAAFTPSNVLLVLHYSNPSPEAWGNLYGAYVPSLALSTLNSCVDPFIYYYVSHEFREKVRAMLCRQLKASSSSQASREAGSRGTAICSSTLL
ncbi:proteinase-activated receptor 4 [Rattus rattus]|uniref:proteinase-activated receptor 4 n=1 Tax=Rattus rattus TaxID=10117 RepID=UPI0013F2EF2C|nr:proteinase-activated receptor 4 [Rattus rattus]